MNKNSEYNFGSFTFTVNVDDDSCRAVFSRSVPVLSTAVLGGGMSFASSVLNMKVRQNFLGLETDFVEPAESISLCASHYGLPEPCSGMMTAASMNSYCDALIEEQGVSVFCCLTAGFSNALAAGDRASFLPELLAEKHSCKQPDIEPGTINIIAGTSIPLAPQAACEALMICSEAKTALIHERGIKSTVSEMYATGTGTDSILVFSAPAADSFESFRSDGEKYCGKHTKLGELFGRAVRQALGSSIDILSSAGFVITEV